MHKHADFFFLKTISPLHAGSGNDLGIIDLPIQREKHTGFPKIEASGLKGSIREAFEALPGEKRPKPLDLHLMFGFDEDAAGAAEVKKAVGDENTQYAGALGFSDARLLFFPVKSMHGVFALVTCPYVLNRLKEDARMAGKEFLKAVTIPAVKTGQCLVPEGSGNLLGSTGEQKIVLEEYTFTATPADGGLISELSGFCENNENEKRIVVLSDDDYKAFVTGYTEVITRTKIDNKTGTVKDGALFNEEYLPVEAILYFMVFAGPVMNNEKGSFAGDGAASAAKVVLEFKTGMPEYLQIGGNATIGKGLVKKFQGKE